MSRTLAILVSAVLTGACAARAAPPVSRSKPEQVTTTVSLADLDLSKPQDIRSAQGRLAAAVKRLCLRLMDDRKAGYWDAYVECSQETLAAALHQMESKFRVAGTQAEGAENTGGAQRSSGAE